jgi:mono/diheme cytochrome c family protein
MIKHLSGLALGAAFAAAPLAAAEEPQVTFTKDIAPLVQQKCQECHRPDGTGPVQPALLQPGPRLVQDDPRSRQ